MIEQIIKQKAREAVKLVLLRCMVIAVDQDAQTCDVEPLNGDAQIFGVKLKAVEDSEQSGMVVFPSVGSDVVVGLTDGTETDAFLVCFSDFDKIQFDNGENEGLVKLPVLRDEVGKLNSFLTAIKTTFQNWTPAPGDGGAALKTAMVAALADEQTADLSEAGNDKILH